MTDYAIRQLACAITMQAVRDYFIKKEYKTVKKTEEMFDKKRKEIIKDLRSAYMDMLSNGQSVLVAEQLEKHPEEIAVRLHKYEEEIS